MAVKRGKGEIADRYHEFEDLGSDLTRDWVGEQNRRCDQYFQKITDSHILELDRLSSFPSELYPLERPTGAFTVRRGAEEEKYSLYFRPTKGEESRIIDSSKLAPHQSIASVKVSWDGKFLAYGLSDRGRDWQTWKILDVLTRNELPESIERIKFPLVSWRGQGFFYSAYPASAPNENSSKDLDPAPSIFYHRLGTSQSDDEEIFSSPANPDWSFVGRVSDDQKFLVIVVHRHADDRNRLFVIDLDSNKVISLVTEFNARYVFFGNRGRQLFFRTDLNATNTRVIGIHLDSPKVVEVIPEQLAESLERVTLVEDSFVCTYEWGGLSRVKVFDLQGNLKKTVALPGEGSIVGLDGDIGNGTLNFSYTDFVTPYTPYRLNVASGAVERLEERTLPFNPSDFKFERREYQSLDGTRIPLLIGSRKGMTTPAPFYLYGYGGFGVSQVPSFSPFQIAWMDRGGGFAVAMIRGGGEYGQGWHEAAIREKKQTTFDDFICAAEFLVDEGWTEAKSLAIGGRSNGGLLVGACLTQRPDLFRACVGEVGVYDMLRFHKFTSGASWVSDYGDPENESERSYLLGYSPLHNVHAREYPAVFLTTGETDDRVFPAHSYKFAAALQANQMGTYPILMRTYPNAGHGYGAVRAHGLRTMAERLSFLLSEIKVSP